jgi:hypothetical protein
MSGPPCVHPPRPERPHWPAQVNRDDPQPLAGLLPEEPPVTTFTEPNTRAVFCEPHLAHSGDRLSE